MYAECALCSTKDYYLLETGSLMILLRKEVIQPHLPIRLPCYDFIPLTKHTLGTFLLERLDQ